MERKWLLFLASILGSTAFCESRECKTGWDQLSVKFPDMKKLPTTVHEAVRQGWVRKDHRRCNGHPFYIGNRYERKGRAGTYVLFDTDGTLAGIQTSVYFKPPKRGTYQSIVYDNIPLVTMLAYIKDGNILLLLTVGQLAFISMKHAKFPRTIAVPKRYWRMFPRENGRYHLTAYFKHPSRIFRSRRSRTTNCVGNSLYIQLGRNEGKLYRVPMRESRLKGTRWTIGKCFNGMGTHYWYDVSKDMSCERFFPVFLLYNNGRLNAFGWALGGDSKDDTMFEHPTPPVLRYFFKPENMPKCLATFKIRSTQHIFLQSNRKNYVTCQR